MLKNAIEPAAAFIIHFLSTERAIPKSINDIHNVDAELGEEEDAVAVS